jgi:hypothetical protein
MAVKASVITLMMEAARTSETLVNFYQTTQRYNPEDSHLLFFYCLPPVPNSDHVMNQMVTKQRNSIGHTSLLKNKRVMIAY